MILQRWGGVILSTWAVAVATTATTNLVPLASTAADVPRGSPAPSQVSSAQTSQAPVEKCATALSIVQSTSDSEKFFSLVQNRHAAGDLKTEDLLALLADWRRGVLTNPFERQSIGGGRYGFKQGAKNLIARGQVQTAWLIEKVQNLVHEATEVEIEKQKTIANSRRILSLQVVQKLDKILPHTAYPWIWSQNATGRLLLTQATLTTFTVPTRALTFYDLETQAETTVSDLQGHVLMPFYTRDGSEILLRVFDKTTGFFTKKTVATLEVVNRTTKQFLLKPHPFLPYDGASTYSPGDYFQTLLARDNSSVLMFLNHERNLKRDQNKQEDSAKYIPTLHYMDLTASPPRLRSIRLPEKVNALRNARLLETSAGEKFIFIPRCVHPHALLLRLSDGAVDLMFEEKRLDPPEVFMSARDELRVFRIDPSQSELLVEEYSPGAKRRRVLLRRSFDLSAAELTRVQNLHDAHPYAILTAKRNGAAIAQVVDLENLEVVLDLPIRKKFLAPTIFQNLTGERFLLYHGGSEEKELTLHSWRPDLPPHKVLWEAEPPSLLQYVRPTPTTERLFGNPSPRLLDLYVTPAQAEVGR